MNELSLIPIDSLIKELENRCGTMVLAYYLPDIEKQTGVFFTYYGKGPWSKSVFLSTVLANDVLSNWNGELKTLQRINDEGIDGLV